MLYQIRAGSREGGGAVTSPFAPTLSVMRNLLSQPMLMARCLVLILSERIGNPLAKGAHRMGQWRAARVGLLAGSLAILTAIKEAGGSAQPPLSVVLRAREGMNF